ADALDSRFGYAGESLVDELCLGVLDGVEVAHPWGEAPTAQWPLRDHLAAEVLVSEDTCHLFGEDLSGFDGLWAAFQKDFEKAVVGRLDMLPQLQVLLGVLGISPFLFVGELPGSAVTEGSCDPSGAPNQVDDLLHFGQDGGENLDPR